jgi:sulfatase modifying factor 1
LRRARSRCVAVVAALTWLAPHAVAGGRATIPGGEFRPVIAPGPAEKTVRVATFQLDRRPVTNAEFLAFVRAHPAWRRDTIAPLFADDHYLGRWATPLDPGPGATDEQPVTDVSWYAAAAYCESVGGRLPSWYEWEYAAAADEHERDARGNPEWRARILGWYSRSAGHPLPDVGTTPANVYGVHDLQGLIWEWVDDYAALMVSGDSRNQGDPDKLAFCGAGALSAEVRDDYAVLMRVALLSSLEARYTTSSLGFRCAADAVKP